MPQALKPPALRPGDPVRIISISSPVEEVRLRKGCEELARLGYVPKWKRDDVLARSGFFAGTAFARGVALKEAFVENESCAIFCSRGGYGVNYLLEELDVAPITPKILAGYSDITSLQLFLWRKCRWVTLYAPMAGSGLDKGAGDSEGYDRDSLLHALTETKQTWGFDLGGEVLSDGVVEGTLLGGCLTLIETSLGTPWELEANGAILVLEDRGMKPWQVDRALMHLKQAGKFHGVAGFILGDFPECEAPPGSETVKDVARRILAPLGTPIIWGAAVGHTQRPMLTVPMGVWARLSTDGETRLDILEPACS
jgi:muramoyltetrapeptide carboxypeptidase